MFCLDWGQFRLSCCDNFPPIDCIKRLSVVKVVPLFASQETQFYELRVFKWKHKLFSTHEEEQEEVRIWELIEMFSWEKFSLSLSHLKVNAKKWKIFYEYTRCWCRKNKKKSTKIQNCSLILARSHKKSSLTNLPSLFYVKEKNERTRETWENLRWKGWMKSEWWGLRVSNAAPGEKFSHVKFCCAIAVRKKRNSQARKKSM